MTDPPPVPNCLAGLVREPAADPALADYEPPPELRPFPQAPALRPESVAVRSPTRGGTS